jgi:hypothetical protein
MSTTQQTPIQVPPPDQIREQLAATVAEARALRKLLRLAEAAYGVREVRNRARRPHPGKEGRGDE